MKTTLHREYYVDRAWFDEESKNILLQAIDIDPSYEQAYEELMDIAIENEDYKVFSSDTSKFKNYSEYDDKRMWEYISNFKLINS